MKLLITPTRCIVDVGLTLQLGVGKTLPSVWLNRSRRHARSPSKLSQ